MVPGVPGRLPNFGTDAFFSGKHTQQSALQLSYGAISNYIGALIGSSGSRNGAVQSFNASTGASSASSKLWVTPSGAVVTWGGGIILGPTSASTPATSKKRSRRKRRKDGVTIYAANLSVAGGGLIVIAIIFFGLTLPVWLDGSAMPVHELLGLGGFWVLGIALTVIPLGAKLEVGEDYIQTSLFGFATMPKVERSDVQELRCENMTAWGISTGKGIKIWKRRTDKSLSSVKPRWAYDASVAESIYGKEAVAHARQVLSNAS
jgi:hypothetical protein